MADAFYKDNGEWKVLKSIDLMNVGGGSSEEIIDLIADVPATTEEVTHFEIDVADPQCYKRIYFIGCIIGSTTNTQERHVAISFNESGQYINHFWFGGAIPKIVQPKRLFGTFDLTDSFIYGNTVTMYDNNTQVHQTHLFHASDKIDRNTPLTTLQLSTQNFGNVFGVGSYFKIWGVRK